MAEQSPNTIDLYKARLGYGARGNLFLVQLRFPEILAVDVEDQREFEILCEKATLPGTRPITAEEIPYQGDYFKLAGEKAAEPEVTFDFKNTEDLKVRTLFENWIELIQQDFTGFRASPTTYKSPSLFISQLDKSKNVIKKVELLGAFPTAVPAIEFALSEGAITTTSITMSIDSHRNIAVSLTQQ